MNGRILIWCIALSAAVPLRGQLSGNNLFEYQLGNLPDTEPSDLSSHYNQLNLGYRYKGLKASLRYEHFLSQNESSNYFRITQFQLQYSLDKLVLRVGNINETLGNGLLVRGYEITGSVFEEEAYRSRYGFYRDLLGFSASYRGDIWYMNTIRGKSLVNTLPPTLPLEERRIDLVEAVETGISLYYQTLGLILMRNSNPFEKDYFYSLLFSGSIPGAVSYNLEYAHHLSGGAPLFAMQDGTRYGLYGSLSYSIGGFGVSLEYKNYHDLLIGTGISDPPTAVREHKYKVLNRSIHVPQLQDESGIQVEAYYTFRNYQRLVFNYVRSVNEFGSTFLFEEFFTEFSFHTGRRSHITLFGDYATDDFKAEALRLAGGLLWEYSVLGRWSTNLHLEYQYIRRDLLERVGMNNGVLIAGVNRSPDLSLSILWEWSSDPFLTESSGTTNGGPEGGKQYRHWPGLEASYRINPTNTLSIFAGKRRGGPACTSGICYEVLDFEGVEIRFRTKFLNRVI